MATLNRVLLPLDGSSHCQKIVPEVEKFISPSIAELVLLHVDAFSPPVGYNGPSLPGGYMSMGSFPETMVESHTTYHPEADFQPANPALDLETEFAPLIKRLKMSGYTVSTHLRLGDPIPEILYFIATQNIDLVAMTTHAREGLSRLILGSVAADILRHINVPVLLLHPAPKYSLAD